MCVVCTHYSLPLPLQHLLVILSFTLPSPPCLLAGQDVKQLIFLSHDGGWCPGTEADCSMVHIFTERKCQPGEVSGSTCWTRRYDSKCDYCHRVVVVVVVEVDIEILIL